MRILSISALNIVMPVPHSPQRYIELFEKAYALHQSISLRADHSGLLGACRLEDVNGVTIVTGEIYKFLNLDLEGQWFNAIEQRPAEEEDLEDLVIPPHLKPHFKTFQYVFFPRGHRLFFISRELSESLTPGIALRFFKDLFNQPVLVQEFGQIEVIVEPSQDTLQRILNMPKLKRLYLEVSPPNADDLNAVEQRVMARLNNQRASKMIEEFVSDRPQGLLPDEETRQLARIAQSNGKVEGRGFDENGMSVALSTEDHPLIDRIEYNPQTTTRKDTLLHRAHTLLNQILQ